MCEMPASLYFGRIASSRRMSSTRVSIRISTPVLRATRRSRIPSRTPARLGWYNDEHRHGGLGLLTPRDVHHGLGGDRLAARDVVLAAAFTARPERFPGGKPSAGVVPTAVWINKPKQPSPIEETPQ